MKKFTIFIGICFVIMIVGWVFTYHTQDITIINKQYKNGIYSITTYQSDVVLLPGDAQKLYNQMQMYHTYNVQIWGSDINMFGLDAYVTRVIQDKGVTSTGQFISNWNNSPD